MNLTQQPFLALCKEAALVPVFKRGNYVAVSNYRPISVLNNFSKLFKFIIRNHILHYIKLRPNQHGFTESKSTVAYLVMFLDFMTLLSEVSVRLMLFDLSNAFDLVPHDVFLHKLSFFGFCHG
jgi:hypothetical protein